MEKGMLQIGFDKAEAEFFAHAYIALDAEDKLLLDTMGNEMSCGEYEQSKPAMAQIMEKLEALAQKYSMPKESMYMLFFMSNFEKMRQKYIQKGIGDLFIETAKDFKYKLNECKKMLGFLGARPFTWYHHFMNADIVALGRFQYHKIKFFEGLTYKWKDITITPEDTVVNFHIPSSGPMTRESRLDSYKKAFEHFGKTKGEYLVLVCVSWLIYPGYKEVFSEGSNMSDFMEDFDIINQSQAEENTFPNSWSVFGRPYDGDTSKYATDTTLQRNFIQFLKEGKRAGWGTGVIIFDGEKIVNNKRDNEK